jgi:hypothetical protein
MYNLTILPLRPITPPDKPTIDVDTPIEIHHFK